MNRRIATFLIAGLTAASAAGNGFDIRAREVTVGKREGADQDLPRGTSRAVTTERALEFEIRCLVPRNDITYRAEWVVLVEQSDGRMSFGTQGEQEFTPRFGKTIALRTDPVRLAGREWEGRRGGSIEDRIGGFGLRIVDGTGSAVAEKTDPPSLHEEIRSMLDRRAAMKRDLGRLNPPPRHPPRTPPPPGRFPPPRP
jgi:hypothetical protein